MRTYLHFYNSALYKHSYSPTGRLCNFRLQQLAIISTKYAKIWDENRKKCTYSEIYLDLRFKSVCSLCNASPEIRNVHLLTRGVLNWVNPHSPIQLGCNLGQRAPPSTSAVGVRRRTMSRSSTRDVCRGLVSVSRSKDCRQSSCHVTDNFSSTFSGVCVPEVIIIIIIIELLAVRPLIANVLHRTIAWSHQQESCQYLQWSVLGSSWAGDPVEFS